MIQDLEKELLENKVKSLKSEIGILESRIEELERDDLTGVLRRKPWEEKVREKLRRQSQVICMVDMDGLKIVNDRHGHVYGDMLIRLLAKAFEHNIKREDLVGRYGGDEFVLALTTEGMENTEKEVRKIFKRIAALFSKTASQYFQNEFDGEIDHCFGFSYGFVFVPKGLHSLEAIYIAADNMLIKEKKSKRTSRLT
ncbi:MAG: GGDEF domain-containing protein [Candidatus Campbellbacteria bacterium]|nr:GGDEF domain-containing protein [Candidatus Campbellbacteria bacterium]